MINSSCVLTWWTQCHLGIRSSRSRSLNYCTVCWQYKKKTHTKVFLNLKLCSPWANTKTHIAANRRVRIQALWCQQRLHVWLNVICLCHWVMFKTLRVCLIYLLPGETGLVPRAWQCDWIQWEFQRSNKYLDANSLPHRGRDSLRSPSTPHTLLFRPDGKREAWGPGMKQGRWTSNLS